MSITIRLGTKARARSTASRPSRTGSVSNSCARSKSQNSFRLSSLSSTTSTRFANGVSLDHDIAMNPTDTNDAPTLALHALAWTLADPARARRLLDLTGLD